MLESSIGLDQIWLAAPSRSSERHVGKNEKLRLVEQGINSKIKTDKAFPGKEAVFRRRNK